MKSKKENISLIDMSKEIAMEKINKKTEEEKTKIVLKIKAKASIRDFTRLIPGAFRDIFYLKLEKTRLSKLITL